VYWFGVCGRLALTLCRFAAIQRDLRRKLLRLRDLFLHRRKQAFNNNVPKIDVFITRETIFEDSYRIIMNLSSVQTLVRAGVSGNSLASWHAISFLPNVAGKTELEIPQ
jgi:hypothetical protein